MKKSAPGLSSSHSISTGQVLITIQEAIATVTLSNPARLNALSMAMWRELADVFTRLSSDLSLRCVVLRGAGDNFAAGADISEFPSTRMDRAGAYQYHQHVAGPALRGVADCLHPTIAMIRGVCVGGGFELACSCDLRIAGRSARVGVPIKRLGFPAAPDEMRGLLAVAGRAVTLELLLEGRILDAQEAREKGLLSRVTKDAATEQEAYECARRIAGGSPIAARINKALARRMFAAPKPFPKSELRAFFASWAESADHHEGVSSFLEKRPPKFNGVAPTPPRKSRRV